MTLIHLVALNRAVLFDSLAITRSRVLGVFLPERLGCPTSTRYHPSADGTAP